ncbi:LAMI_0F08878g1_1 [Lachancea mirantina]|uniref:LAMI_0F08878g1_1 n=1 Tax=Lachancea mirantina TaxID=1230905 RepID=A0A1G4K0N7_9SACH|nr:LAMI_0F08878g1_1 [Lachancea mirantina]
MGIAREREEDFDQTPDVPKLKKRPSSAIMGISRSIAACKRCRMKKVKCDQKFPSCSKCVAADEPCVSVDPATGKDVPRSYVIYLEDRVEIMTKKLLELGVDASALQGNIPATSEDRPCDVSYFEEKMRAEHKVPVDNAMAGYIINNGTSMRRGVSTEDRSSQRTMSSIGSDKSNAASPILSELSESSRNLASLSAMKHIKKKSPLNSASNSYLGDSSGIPFAKLMFTAVNFQPEEVQDDSEPEHLETSSKVNFELLHLPPKHEAEELVSQYFALCNSQLPILHREHFLKKYFEPIYGTLSENVSLASDYTRINKDFKLSSAEDSAKDSSDIPLFEWLSQYNGDEEVSDRFHIPLFFINMIMAIGSSARFLDTKEATSVTFKDRASYFMEALFCSTDRLEALAGTLLIAEYSIMRPNVPGVWYTMGSALRLAVDLGLHAEKLNRNYDPFVRDYRRRLFWCTYSLDRQICAYFGRPFGIPEENISAEFPSSLDDGLITTAADNIEDYSLIKSTVVSYKSISLAFFKIRKIQAQIVQVLYAPKGALPKEFENLEQWRFIMDHELNNWYTKEIPKTHRKMNCIFKPDLFQLNYHHTKVMLYGLCPKISHLDRRAHEAVYESTKGIIEAYYKLCVAKDINYTWVAVHNLFMAGMTFLYAVHNADKSIVDNVHELHRWCEKLMYVLKCLIGTCDAAKNCHKIFKVLSAVVLQLKAKKNAEFGSGGPTSFQPIQEEHPEAAPVHETKEEDLVQPLESFAPSFANDVALDQFFQELNRLSPSSDGSRNAVPLSNFNSPGGSRETPSNGIGLDLPVGDPRTSMNKSIEKRKLSKDGQKVYEMINQVSADTIWDQFFKGPV